MGAPVEMVGKRFGRLTVIKRGPDHESNGNRTRRWFCRCDCGVEVLTFGNGLRSGHAKSCGCLHKDVIAARNTSHGKSGSKTYAIWAAMWARCTNPAHSAFQHYGGRGISVCERWKSFENFLADMGEQPNGFSIERKDVMGDYSPGNCKWSTAEEQANNKRNSVFVTVNGKTQTYSQWARELGVDPGVLRRRYLKFGTFEPIRRDYGSLKRKSNGQYSAKTVGD